MEVFVQLHSDLQRLILLNLTFDEQKKICDKFPNKLPMTCQPNDKVMIMRLDKDYNIQKPFTLRQYYDLIDRVSKSDKEFYYRQKMYGEYIKSECWTKKMVDNLINDEVFLKNHINDEDKCGDSLLINLVGINTPKDVIVNLIQDGANVNQINKVRQTPLIAAIDSGNIEFVQLLLDNGADIDYENTFGTRKITPLLFSFIIQEPEITKILIKNKANINYQDSDGSTALMYAAKIYNPILRKEIIQLLLDAGADPTIVNNKGQTYQDILDKWERIDKLED
jgi:hypothetical protein